MVQRIMNTVEKTSTGVSPAELILNNSIRLTERILLPPTQTKSSGQFALSDTMNEWVPRQTTLVRVARDKQLQTDYYSPVQVIVYKLTITTITSSFTSCDATRSSYLTLAPVMITSVNCYQPFQSAVMVRISSSSLL